MGGEGKIKKIDLKPDMVIALNVFLSLSVFEDLSCCSFKQKIATFTNCGHINMLLVLLCLCTNKISVICIICNYYFLLTFTSKCIFSDYYHEL